MDIQLQLGRSLNIVTLYEVYEDDQHVHLQLELCTGGSLLEREDIARGGFGLAEARGVARAVLQSIAQCHAHHVAYRDVKPENFLYLSKEPGSPLKVCFALRALSSPLFRLVSPFSSSPRS